MMNELQEIIGNNSMLEFYTPLLKKKQCKKYYISVVIPVMGRIEFLKPLIKTLKEAMKKVDKRINITVVEHSHDELFRKDCRELDVNYYWIPKTPEQLFNKCLCHNIGAMLNKQSDYFLFHDLDCLVFDDFFDTLIYELEKGSVALQTFKRRRLLYLPENITQDIIHNNISPDKVDLSDTSIVEGEYGAPGGSICVDKNLFVRIGGFDPELFSGYSPEDRFFWAKMECFTDVHSVSNEILHMSHERLDDSNDKLIQMREYLTTFNQLSDDVKLEFLENKKNIIIKNF